MSLRFTEKVPSAWLILMLSTMNPDHFIFAPGYYPRQPPTVQMRNSDIQALAQVPGFRSILRPVSDI
jgi:hypothetical protein